MKILLTACFAVSAFFVSCYVHGVWLFSLYHSYTRKHVNLRNRKNLYLPLFSVQALSMIRYLTLIDVLFVFVYLTLFRNILCILNIIQEYFHFRTDPSVLVFFTSFLPIIRAIKSSTVLFFVSEFQYISFMYCSSILIISTMHYHRYVPYIGVT